MSASRLARWGGLAAMLGGVMWVFKGGAIMLTGEQPPIVFEAALPLFAAGLVGLHARLGGRGGRLGKTGLLLAYAALASALVALVGLTLVPAGWVPNEDSVTLLTPFIVLAGFGPFVGLVLLGIVTLRVKAMPAPWSALPLVMGAGAVPLMLVGGILELVNERLFEFPIVLLGFAWVLLGYSVLVVKGATVEAPVRVR
ncbi:MAG: hypothetical protein WKF53_08940 [Rubrobacter sp.]